MYWPYLPLIILVMAGLWLGHPTAERSQRGTVDFATNISSHDLLAQTNQTRLSNGDKPLVADVQLNAAATAKAQDMVNHNYWLNNNVAGKTPVDFASRAGYSALDIRENIAYGFQNSQQAVIGWLNSPSRRANLLNPAHQQVGFGIAKSQNFIQTGPETIIVAFFAQPVSAASSPNSAQSGTAAVADAFASSGTTTISRIQTMTNGRMPWISAVLAITAVSSVILLVIKNGWHFQKSRKKGQKFALKHPVFDLTIIAFAALVALLCQSVGYIR